MVCRAAPACCLLRLPVPSSVLTPHNNYASSRRVSRRRRHRHLVHMRSRQNRPLTPAAITRARVLQPGYNAEHALLRRSPLCAALPTTPLGLPRTTPACLPLPPLPFLPAACAAATAPAMLPYTCFSRAPRTPHHHALHAAHTASRTHRAAPRRLPPHCTRPQVTAAHRLLHHHAVHYACGSLHTTYRLAAHTPLPACLPAAFTLCHCLPPFLPFFCTFLPPVGVVVVDATHHTFPTHTHHHHPRYPHILPPHTPPPPHHTYPHTTTPPHHTPHHTTPHHPCLRCVQCCSCDHC